MYKTGGWVNIEYPIALSGANCLTYCINACPLPGPNCAGPSDIPDGSDSVCCESVPDGLFCTPDSVNMTMKTPEELNDANMCERFRFISGIDEMAMNAEMGLYFDFSQQGGYPGGCPGLDLMPFDGNYSSYWDMWSNLPGGQFNHEVTHHHLNQFI